MASSIAYVQWQICGPDSGGDDRQATQDLQTIISSHLLLLFCKMLILHRLPPCPPKKHPYLSTSVGVSGPHAVALALVGLNSRQWQIGKSEAEEAPHISQAALSESPSVPLQCIRPPRDLILLCAYPWTTRARPSCNLPRTQQNPGTWR